MTADRLLALETIRRMHRRAAAAGEDGAAAHYAAALDALRALPCPRPASRFIRWSRSLSSLSPLSP